MQSEQDWIGRIDEDEVNGAAERYAYFMRPEPFEDLGPIRLVDDPWLGKKAKVRDMKVGMTRNAADENKMHVTVYLQPFPHIRIDKAKPLQGWYKAIYEPPNVRPRPCFTEAILTEPYGGYCAVGCSFAICSGQTIDSPSGPILIDELKSGDVVWGRTIRGIEPCVVGEIVKQFTSNAIEVILSNGLRISLTPDHPIYINGKGWIRTDQALIGDQMELFDEQMLYLPETFWNSEDLLKEMSQRASTSGIFSSQTSEKKARSIMSGVSEAYSQYKSSDLFREMSLRFTLQENEGKQQRSSQTFNQTLQGLWDNNSLALQNSMSRMSFEDQVREREKMFGKNEWIEGDSQISYDENETQQLCHDSGYGRSGKVEVGKEVSLQNPQHAFSLGGFDSSISGFSKNQMVLRRYSNNPQQRTKIHPRFSSGDWGVYRSERLYGRNQQVKNTQSESFGISNRSLGRAKAQTATIVALNQIKSDWVYDFETSSENYYVNGVLVHNCYINSGMRGYRGTGLITVPLNYGDQIKSQLAKTNRSAAGYFSSFTDPFTPLENYYHNTQKGAEAFVAEGLPIFFLSRLPYPKWAVDLLKENPYSYAQKSINTPDPDDWRLLSPGALGLEEHLEEIAMLKRNKIYVSIQCNPILPGITTHSQVCELFTKLKKAGANHVIVKFVEAGYSWAPEMVVKNKKRFGEKRGSQFEKLFQENIGGQRTIVESYRLEGHKIYQAHATKIGLTYATCYEYKYERNAGGQIVNKTGVSIGREYTTADQCHGQRVPMFYRNAKGKFEEVEDCPPSGCMYCAAENDGEPRCGDALAGEGKALRLVDLKIPFENR